MGEPQNNYNPDDNRWGPPLMFIGGLLVSMDTSLFHSTFFAIIGLAMVVIGFFKWLWFT